MQLSAPAVVDDDFVALLQWDTAVAGFDADDVRVRGGKIHHWVEIERGLRYAASVAVTQPVGEMHNRVEMLVPPHAARGVASGRRTAASALSTTYDGEGPVATVVLPAVVTGLFTGHIYWNEVVTSQSFSADVLWVKQATKVKEFYLATRSSRPAPRASLPTPLASGVARSAGSSSCSPSATPTRTARSRSRCDTTP